MADNNQTTSLDALMARINSLTTTAGVKQPIEEYIEKLITEKGFEELTPEVREQIKQDLLKRIDDFIMARVISALTDADVAEFETMLKDKKTDLEIQGFIASHIENFAEFLTNTLLEFRGVYLGVIQAPVPERGELQEASNSKSSVLPEAPLPAPVAPDDKLVN